MTFRQVLPAIIAHFLLFTIVCVLSAPRKSAGRSCQSNQRNKNDMDSIFLNPDNPFLTRTIALPAYLDNPFLKQSEASKSNNNNLYPTGYPPVGYYNDQIIFPTSDYDNLMNGYKPPLMIKNISKGSSMESSLIEGSSFQNPLTRKSELKCQEYKKTIIKGIGATLSAILPDIDENDDTICAISSVTVVGGVPAVPGEFPHMVSLGKRSANGKFDHLCGGTLISPNWILTAAHCTYSPNGSPNVVRIGFHELNDTSGLSLPIKKIMRHPMYRPPPMYGDIALVQLNGNVTFNGKIRPACLHLNSDLIPENAWITGWGVTEFGSIEPTNELQKATLGLLKNTECSKKFIGSGQVPDGILPSMICAVDSKNWSRDTCQGDSGGPLQTYHPRNKCVFQIIGVTSFGEGCAVIGRPGVYTRVSYYLNWIEENVWPN